jgi:hypothetical protein
MLNSSFACGRDYSLTPLVLGRSPGGIALLALASRRGNSSKLSSLSPAIIRNNRKSTAIMAKISSKIPIGVLWLFPVLYGGTGRNSGELKLPGNRKPIMTQKRAEIKQVETRGGAHPLSGGARQCRVGAQRCCAPPQGVSHPCRQGRCGGSPFCTTLFSAFSRPVKYVRFHRAGLARPQSTHVPSRESREKAWSQDFLEGRPHPSSSAERGRDPSRPPHSQESFCMTNHACTQTRGSSLACSVHPFSLYDILPLMDAVASEETGCRTVPYSSANGC